LTLSGDLKVIAETDSDIFALTISGAGAARGAGVAGSVSINTIRFDTLAGISGSSVTADGAVTLRATDESDIIANAGGISIAVGGNASAAFGASVAINKIENTVKATISESTVTSGEGVDLVAEAESDIWSLAIGGAVSGSGEQGAFTVAAGGAGTGNTVKTSQLRLGGRVRQ
jgi:hypothetical protein